MFSKIWNQYRGLTFSIYIIFIARMVTSMGSFIWPMMTFIMKGNMGLEDTTIGIVSAVTGVLFIPASILGGKLADRFDKKKIIILFDSISVSFFIACSFVEPGIPMLVMFSLAGLFANMEWPAFDALIVEASKPSEREKVFSLNYMGMNLGLVFGALMSGYLYKNHLSLAFTLDGMTTLASTILIILFVKSLPKGTMAKEEVNEYEDEEHSAKRTWHVLLARKPVLMMIVVFSLASLIYEQWSFSLPLFLSSMLEADGAVLYGHLMSFNAGIVIVLTPVLTAWLSRLKELQKIFFGIGLYSLSFLLIVYDPSKGMLFFMIFLFTLGEIINTIGNNPYISRRVPASHRGRVASYMGIGHMFGATIGRVGAGVLNDRLGYNFTFTAIALLGVVCIAGVLMVYGFDKRRFPKLYISKATENR